MTACEELQVAFSQDRQKSFATYLVGNRTVTVPVNSKEFQAALARKRSAPADRDLPRAVEFLSHQQLSDAEYREVYIRLAMHQGCIYIDVGDDAGSTILVTKDGWSVIKSPPPVLFVRPTGTAPLPLPLRTGEDLLGIGDLLSIEDDDVGLAVAGLLGFVCPWGPYPIVLLQGEAGSGKTTATRFLRDLVDPRGELRSESRDARDLLIGANKSWIYGLDNLSSMTKLVADTLCRLTSGGSISTRKQYSDDDEVILSARRPVIMNGIPDLDIRTDVADRALLVRCRPPSRRRTERDLRAAFESVRPGLLGSLLDAVVAALANEGTVSIENLPRNADHALWCEAAASAVGWSEGEIAKTIFEHRSQNHGRALRSDPFVAAVIAALLDPMSGTAADLAALLNDPRWESAEAVGRRLHKVESVLAELGYRVDWHRTGTARRFTITPPPGA